MEKRRGVRLLSTLLLTSAAGPAYGQAVGGADQARSVSGDPGVSSMDVVPAR